MNKMALKISLPNQSYSDKILTREFIVPWAEFGNKHSGRLGLEISVDVATYYGMDGLEIGTRWGRHFLHPYGTSLELTQVPVQWVP
jgi:hypothetical protein